MRTTSQDHPTSGRLRNEESSQSASTPPGDRSSAVPGASSCLAVAVGSCNPVKVAATRQSFAEIYGDTGLVLHQISVPSGVSDQPMDTEEALTGAVNRARAAVMRCNADVGVGLEGGVTLISGRWYCIGWVALVNWAGESWAAPTAGVPVPATVMDLILNEELELGDAEDKVFDRINTKQNGGLIGIITGERISRLDNFYQPLVTAICAMRMDGELNNA